MKRKCKNCSKELKFREFSVDCIDSGGFCRKCQTGFHNTEIHKCMSNEKRWNIYNKNCKEEIEKNG